MSTAFPITFPLHASTPFATLSLAAPGIYLLSMHNLPDNRLTPDYIKHSLLPALDHVELHFWREYNAGRKEAAFIITGERQKHKFFSNGLQLELVAECPGFFKDLYYLLMSRVLTFPMPTLSALNGHCFAGGFTLAQCTDYRLIRSQRAWACMNELDFGAPLPVGMEAVLASRLPAATLRRVMLTAHRFTADEALAAGIVDEVVKGDAGVEGGEAVIKRAVEVAQGLKKGSASGVMTMLKETLFANAVQALSANESMRDPTEKNAQRFQELEKRAKL